MAMADLVLPLLITYLNSTPTQFGNLINTIVDSEDLSYIHILKDVSVEIPDQIFSHITKVIPNVIIDISQPVNFLNLDFQNDTLAFSFNARTMFIAFLESQVDSRRISAIQPRTEFLKDSWIIVVLPDNSTDRNKKRYVQTFYNKFHNNIIALDSKSFESERQFYSADLYPTFEPKVKSFDNTPPIKTNAMNIEGREITFLCPGFTDCMEFKKGQWLGMDYNIILGFSKFINASLKVFNEKDFKAKFGIVPYDKEILHIDFKVKESFLNPRNLNLKKAIPRTLKKAIITFQFSYVVVVPSPVEISQKYYIIRPFTLPVWMTLVCFVLGTSFLLKLTFKTTGRESEFMQLLGEIIKAFIAQSFNFKQKGRMIVVIQVFLIIVSFMVNVWYLSILGSYLTSLIYEKPLKTIEDLAEHATPFVISLKNYEGLVGKGMRFEKLKDQLNTEEINKEIENELMLSGKYAYIESDFHYDHVTYPSMRFYNSYKNMKSEIILNRNFYTLTANPNSRYTEAARRYISLINDVGLAQHWKSMIFLESLKSKNIPWIFEKDADHVVVLTFEYFIYIYYFWMVGVVVSFFVFCVEIVWHYSKKMSFKKSKVQTFK